MQFSIQESSPSTKEELLPVDKIAQLVGQLSAEHQQQLLDYAQFLVDKYPLQQPVAETSVQTPVDIPRPEEESVVAAIKRLSESYFMIDRSKMLHETAALMSEHVMQGREAQEVIDDVEALFQRYYQKYCGDS